VSAVSFHKVMQVKRRHEWVGSIVALSYMAAQRVFRIIMIWQIIKLT
jgi:hypothetical protein